ncbi:M15 family metallopeptidase [Mycetocola spongiae]|uniref:M15 family metallopeptidase n=1 Tax=Mycetocola spongiae TaxID=2859226 RepID=UPI001CF425F4|nr:M15 family metallopeptidase [Mycetocola spongiae]UCR88035.1 M15 family metallopeptidase [Mycetocola spongiae]
MMTLISDPDVARIPVIDSGEPLIDLASRGLHCAPNIGAAALVREGLATRLLAAEAALPEGIHLLIVEGLRPRALQEAIIADYLVQLREGYPEASPERLLELSARFVAPVNVAPHVAGAAVDLTLMDSAGTPLDLGTEIDTTPEQSAGACVFGAANISPLARRNRILLARVLGAAGLENYPHEWWHWSYGDRYWAHLTSAPHALYGPVGEPLAP